MAKLRLAIFNTQPPQLYFGGVERRIMEVTKRLQNDADIMVYSGTKAGFKTPTSIKGANFVPCKSTDRVFPLDNWTYNRSVSKGSMVFGADVFEVHNNSAYNLPDCLHKRGINRPIVHLIHGTLADEYEQGKKGPQTLRGRLANAFMKLQAKQEKNLAQKATIVATISKYSQAKIIEHYGIDENKIRIVPNGVDIERFKPTDAVSAKQQLNLDQEPTILFMGSLVHRKGLLYLVKAAEKVVKKQANTKFVIVGTGPLRSQIEEAVASANLKNNFTFLGNLKEEQLPTAYNAAEIFVLPSVQEGQGIVLLEAQACAKPVVAFGVGGAKEAVRQNETGFLLNLGDTDGFTDKLLTLLNNKDLRFKMGEAGRKYVSENYTWDLCAQRMLKVYNEALAK